MKIKLFSAIIAALLVLSMSVIAADRYSLRGSSGTIDSIDANTMFTLEKVSFSLYQNIGTGKGNVGLSVQATTDGGKTSNVRVSGNYETVSVLQDDATTLKVHAQAQNAVYWQRGSAPMTGNSDIVVEYNKITGMTSVVGSGLVSFQVSNIPTVAL